MTTAATATPGKEGEKKSLDEMPVKPDGNRRREEVQDLVLHPETIVTTRTDVPELPCTLLPSGTLHNSLPVFLRHSNPCSYDDSLGSLARFHPLQAEDEPYRRNNGTHQASRINYARLSPTEK